MNKWGYIYLIKQKTLWEKENSFIASNFSLLHKVFKNCLLLMHQNEYLWSKGLNNSHGEDFWKHLGKSENVVN